MAWCKIIHNCQKFLLDRTFGTTIQNLRVDILEKFPIPIISLEEQIKIIAGLNKIKQSIQNAQQIVDNLKLPLFVSLMKPIKTQKLALNYDDCHLFFIDIYIYIFLKYLYNMHSIIIIIIDY